MYLPRAHSTQRWHWYLVALAALAACYPMSFWIRPEWSRENGILENAQAVVLVAGCLWAGVVWWRARPAPVAMLARCAIPVWAILAGRELSWGAVWLPPMAMTAEGPMFSSHALWYKAYVAPVLLGLIAWSLWTACRHRIDRVLVGLIAARRFPWPAALCVIGASLESTCGEGHLSCGLVSPNMQGLEELAELAGYLALFLAQGSMFRSCAQAAGASVNAFRPRSLRQGHRP